MLNMAMRSDTSEAGRALARARWGSRSRAVDRALADIAARTALIEPDQADRLSELARAVTAGAEPATVNELAKLNKENH